MAFHLSKYSRWSITNNSTVPRQKPAKNSCISNSYRGSLNLIDTISFTISHVHPLKSLLYELISSKIVTTHNCRFLCSCFLFNQLNDSTFLSQHGFLYTIYKFVILNNKIATFHYIARSVIR